VICFEWYKGKLALIFISISIFYFVSFILGLKNITTYQEVMGFVSFFILVEMIYWFFNVRKTGKSFNGYFYRDYCFWYL
jgi:hypothetical protein